MEQNDKGKFCDELTFEQGLNERVLKALEEGKGSAPLGLSKGAVCNGEYFVTDIDFCSNIVKPQNWNPMTESGEERTWNDLSEEEKKNEGGRLIEWYTLVTDKGNISFTQFFGSSDYDTKEYWENADMKSSAFDISLRLHPIAKSPNLWIKHGCKIIKSDGTKMGIKNQWIHCLAEKDDVSGSFTTKARFFALGRLPENATVINLKEIRAKKAEEEAKKAENPDDAQ